MKQIKLLVIILLLAVLIITSVALAAWHNYFNWNIGHVSLECTKAKDCQDIYKNCYYSCSSNKCVQIETFVALKPYPDCSSVVSCIPNWQCDWGPCVSGAQSMTVIDSNNCGLPASTAEIACPALARLCNSPTQSTGQVTKKVGEKEFNFLIQKINANSVDGLIYTLYPVARLQGDAKTLHLGDIVGYACEGKTAIISSIDVTKQVVIFDETIKSAPLGGCPI